MPKTRSRSRLWAVAPLAVLVFAVWQVSGTLSRTPAFNAVLRVEGANGSSFPARGRVMYDRALYYFWTARSWNFVVLAGRLPGVEGSDQWQAAAQDAHRRARASALESLKQDPGDPAAWMVLAEAQAGLGEGEPALQAVKNSWKRAPNRAIPARSRLVFLTRFMAQPEGRELALAQIPPEMVAEDLRVMGSVRAYASHAEVLAENEAIAAFGGH